MDDIQVDDEPEAFGPDIVEVIDDDEPETANVELGADTPGEESDEQEADPEADDDAESDEDQPDDEQAEDDGPAQEMVKFTDGTEVPLAEVEKGYLRDADYRRKTTEVAEERRAVEAERDTYRQRLESFQQTQSKLIPFFESLIPPEPSYSLAQTDPGAYTRQQAERQAAIAELQAVIGANEEVQGQRSEAYEADLAKWRDAEQAALVKAMPDLKDEAKRAAFDKGIRETAKEFGFTDEDLNGPQANDHRTQRILHYARLGLMREKTLANATNAKRRVEAPRKGAAGKPAPTAQQGSQKALRRLQQTGSVDDAVAMLMGRAR